MGAEVETLADLLAPDLRAITIGINPAPTSVAAGHYYQGRLGQQFFGRLERAGVVIFSGDGWQDDQAFDQAIGFTDLVKRPTPRADEITSAELEHGRTLLAEKLRSHGPGLLIFTFKKCRDSIRAFSRKRAS